LQLFYGILVPGRVFDRLLTGPTNDVWIDPWQRICEISASLWSRMRSCASSIVQGKRIRSVSVERAGQLEQVTADYYVCAVPVEVMQSSASPELVRAAPSLARLGELRTEWMNGIQFYVRTDQPLADGHAIYLDSNWALTSISQRQFWHGYDLSKYGDGRVGGILSVDISNWTAPGNFNRKPAMAAASREEIKDEVLGAIEGRAQCKGHVTARR
jgi:hypothetical protein